MSAALPFVRGLLLVLSVCWVDQQTYQRDHQLLINRNPTTVATTLKRIANSHDDGDGDGGTDDDNIAFRNELVALLHVHASLTSQ